MDVPVFGLQLLPAAAVPIVTAELFLNLSALLVRFLGLDLESVLFVSQRIPRGRRLHSQRFGQLVPISLELLSLGDQDLGLFHGKLALLGCEDAGIELLLAGNAQRGYLLQ